MFCNEVAVDDSASVDLSAEIASSGTTLPDPEALGEYTLFIKNVGADTVWVGENTGVDEMYPVLAGEPFKIILRGEHFYGKCATSESTTIRGMLVFGRA